MSLSRPYDSTAPRACEFITNRVSRPIDIPTDAEMTLELFLFTPTTKQDHDFLNALTSVQLSHLFYINYLFSDKPSSELILTSLLSSYTIVDKRLPFARGQVLYNKIDDEASPSYHSKGLPSITTLFFCRSNYISFYRLLYNKL